MGKLSPVSAAEQIPRASQRQKEFGAHLRFGARDSALARANGMIRDTVTLGIAYEMYSLI